MQLKLKSISMCVMMATFFLVEAHATAQSAQTSSQEIQDSEGYSQTYLTCMKSANENLLRGDVCMSNEMEYQDKRLNKIYKDLLGLLKPGSKSALIDSERIWIKLNSADENFESLLYGDNTQMGNAWVLKNNLSRTRARTQVLEKYLKFVQTVGG